MHMIKPFHFLRFEWIHLMHDENYTLEINERNNLKTARNLYRPRTYSSQAKFAVLHGD